MMTITDRNRRISRFLTSGDDFWDALEDFDLDVDDDPAFTLDPHPVHSVPPRRWQSPAWLNECFVGVAAAVMIAALVVCVVAPGVLLVWIVRGL